MKSLTKAKPFSAIYYKKGENLGLEREIKAPMNRFDKHPIAGSLNYPPPVINLFASSKNKQQIGLYFTIFSSKLFCKILTIDTFVPI